MRQRCPFDRVAPTLVLEIVLMAGSSARRMARLHEEAFEIFVHLEHVVGIARLGDNGVPALDVVRRAVREDLGFPPMDEPDFVIVVVVAVEAGPRHRNSETADSNRAKPVRSRALVYPSRREIEYGRFLTSRGPGRPVNR